MSPPGKNCHVISPKEYLEGERFSDIRYEYVEGSFYARPGASDDHNRIAGNIYCELSQRLRGGACEAFIGDMKVKAVPEGDLFYYPDVLVACDPTDAAKYFRERPSVIFEVFSPETERTDRHEKLLAYGRISSLRSYVLVPQDRVAASVFRRTSSGWETENLEGAKAILRLPEIDVQIPLALIYKRTAAAQE